MCDQFTFHHQFGIDTWRSKFEQQRRQCSFCLWIPWTKNHKDPDTIDLNAPRHAQYMHQAWKKHQNTVYWVDINLALKRGLKFYQTRSNAIILHETLPAYSIPKVVRMETGEVIYEKVFASPRLPPKIPFKDNWMKKLGSEVAQRPDGQAVQQSQSSQSNQPTPNPDHDRTRHPVVGTDRTVQPVVGTSHGSRCPSVCVIPSMHELSVSSDFLLHHLHLPPLIPHQPQAVPAILQLHQG